MAIIKLTKSGGILEGDTLYVNTNQIVWISKHTKKIKFSDGEIFYPKETPEEILALIKGAEAKDFSQKFKSYVPEPPELNPHVQDIIDKAHANEILMREKDPTYGR